jgi:hypothetical protein
LIGGEVEVRAKNLVLESVQDEASYASKGFNLSIGLSQDDKANRLVGGSVGGDVAEYNKKMTRNIAKIIGEQGVNIAVLETLGVTASVIASAKMNEDGSLSEEGKAYVNAARMIIKTLHDYDDGYSMGLGVHYQVQSKGAKEKFNIGGLDVKLDYKDKSSDLLSYVQGMKGDGLSSNINSLRSNERGEEFGFDATIYPNDIVEVLKNLSKGGEEIKPKEEELEVMELELIEEEEPRKAREPKEKVSGKAPNKARG